MYETQTNAIEMKHVTKKYASFQLEDVSLTLPSGCIMGLVGENGAGKSTTIGLIMGSIRRDAGEIFVLGQDNTKKEFDAVKEDIGVVLDEAYFPEVLNAVNVNQIMKHTYQRWDEKQYFDYIKHFSLEEKKMFKDYSRGMKMKLAIAVALSHKPKLLILDEATSGLDPIIRDEILEIFNEFTREEDHTVLLSSHIISDLEKISDYIAFLHQGKLLFCEEKDRLLEEYGILQVTEEEEKDIPKEAIAGRKQGKYATELLVKRSKISDAFEIECAGIEDIVLFLARKGE
ncbi:ABC transporter ATP-binding protein [Roseburia sp. BX1005]|uniref:ABC transporter ATP-binding protein n=2 Tax=Roseburia zhanii TaxID=2763064 RepID=A0A923RVJ9_9FIRM|nr:ABC transporter ATP-binding protein [Roseburia zhanii]